MRQSLDLLLFKRLGMINIACLTTLMLLIAAIPSSGTENLEEGVSYPYPFFYDDTESYFDEDAGALESKADSSKAKSPPAWQGNIGKAEVTIDVENTDFLSQCQDKWDKMQKKNKPEEKKKERSNHWDDEDDKDEDKDDHSPHVSVSIKWRPNK